MDLENKSDAEILAIADPIMDNLMEASTRIDHAAQRHTVAPDRKAQLATLRGAWPELRQVTTKFDAGGLDVRPFVLVFADSKGCAGPAAQAKSGIDRTMFESGTAAVAGTLATAQPAGVTRGRHGLGIGPQP